MLSLPARTNSLAIIKKRDRFRDYTFIIRLTAPIIRGTYIIQSGKRIEERHFGRPNPIVKDVSNINIKFT